MIAGVLIIAVIVASVGAYAAITYPRAILSVNVSLTIGADFQRKEFDVPFLHTWVRVEVAVVSGTSLWSAKILSGETVLWSNAETQGGQTTYDSDWFQLPSGRYNFTFATFGFQSLEANVKVTSKGGFW